MTDCVASGTQSFSRILLIVSVYLAKIKQSHKMPNFAGYLNSLKHIIVTCPVQSQRDMSIMIRWKYVRCEQTPVLLCNINYNLSQCWHSSGYYRVILLSLFIILATILPRVWDNYNVSMDRSDVEFSWDQNYNYASTLRHGNLEQHTVTRWHEQKRR